MLIQIFPPFLSSGLPVAIGAWSRAVGWSALFRAHLLFLSSAEEGSCFLKQEHASRFGPLSQLLPLIQFHCQHSQGT